MKLCLENAWEACVRARSNRPTSGPTPRALACCGYAVVHSMGHAVGHTEAGGVRCGVGKEAGARVVVRCALAAG